MPLASSEKSFSENIGLGALGAGAGLLGTMAALKRPKDSNRKGWSNKDSLSVALNTLLGGGIGLATPTIVDNIVKGKSPALNYALLTGGLGAAGYAGYKTLNRLKNLENTDKELEMQEATLPSGQTVEVPVYKPIPKKKRDAEALSKLIRNLGIIGTGIGGGALALGSGITSPESIQKARDFTALADNTDYLKNLPAADRMKLYESKASDLAGTRLFGIPASVILQNARNLKLTFPFLKTDIGESGGYPDHYLDFLKGPLAARMRLYKEEISRGGLSQDKLNAIDSKVRDLSTNLFKTEEYGQLPKDKQEILLKQLDASKLPEDVTTAKNIAEKNIGEWTTDKFKAYGDNAVKPLLGARDALLRYGAYAGVGGLGLLGMWALYRSVQNRKKKKMQQEAIENEQK